MKTFLLKLIAFTFSIGAFAMGSAAPSKTAHSTEINAINILLNRQTRNSNAFKAFQNLNIYVDNVQFTRKGSQNESLTLSGIMVVEGDIVCGSVGLQITSKWIAEPHLFGTGYYAYGSKIVTDGIDDYCKRSFNLAVGKQPIGKLSLTTGAELKNARELVNVLLDKSVFNSSAFKSFTEKVDYVSEVKYEFGKKSDLIELTGMQTTQGDIAIGYLTLKVKGRHARGNDGMSYSTTLK